MIRFLLISFSMQIVTCLYDASFEVMCDFGDDCSGFCDSDFCEYNWEVAHRHSMTWRTMDHGPTMTRKIKDYPIAWDERNETFSITGEGYHSPEYPPLHEDMTVKDPMRELYNIMPVDGRSHRRVITINGEFIGPTIRVRQGAVVKVNVFNRLANQPLTVHWHGLFQTDNFWMDGAAWINQCPVNTYHTFSYIWRAEHAG